MKCCCVPGCRTGYTKTEERISLFVLPGNNELLRNLWVKKIPRKETADFKFISKHVYVCEKHFSASDIIREDEFTVQGKVVKSQRDKPKLKPDAVPHISENLPSYLSAPAKKKRPNPRDRSCPQQSSSAEHRTLSCTAGAESSSNLIVQIPEENASNETLLATEDSHISPITECQRLKEKVYQLTREKKALLEKIATMKIAEEERQNNIFLTNEQFAKLPVKLQLIINEAVRLSKCSTGKGMRYDSGWILDCVLLKMKSNAAYEFLRQNSYLPLPHASSLHRHIRCMNADFGFDHNLFSALKEKVHNLPQQDRMVSLVFDEMALQKHIEVRKGDLKLVGNVDYGDMTPVGMTTVADHALVFVVNPYYGGWIQTIGTFAAAGATPFTVLSELLIKCIILLHNSGIKVVSVTCDNSTSNRACMHSLGVCGDQENLCYKFPHPCNVDQPVFVVFDPPHIVKCVRNNLFNCQEFKLPDGESVQYQHYKTLYRLDSQNINGLRAVPKLSATHLQPNNFQKMSVKYAVQLFSNSVACGMEFYSRTTGVDELQGCEATIQFTRRMNELFDILNTKVPANGIQQGSQKLQVLKDMICWLDAGEKYIEAHSNGKTSRKFISSATCSALRITLHSVHALILYLHGCGMKYVLTSKLQQDCIEVCDID